MDLTTITTIVTLILALITALGVWLGPRIAEHSRRIHQAKQLHLESIKSGVYQPLLYQLENYSMPVIEREISNIIEKTVSIASSEIQIDEYGRINRFQLSIRTLEDMLQELEMQDFTRDASGLSRIEHLELIPDRQLYEDVKENHEPTLIVKWESFQAKLAGYNSQCLQYVERIAEQLAKQTGLRVWDNYDSKPGTNTTGLAVFVWERQIGLGSSQFFVEKTGEITRAMVHNKVVAIGTDDEIARCRQVLDGMVKDRVEVDKLTNTVNEMRLMEECALLEEKFTHLIHSHKLSGNCKYTKP